jgi:hypothetical protein
MEEKPNYYAIIPANVRYDKELKANAKLMYGEITALSSKNGICTASNNYFARLYEVDSSAISKWIKQLKDRNYIEIEYQTDGKEIKNRIIRMVGIDKCQQVLPKDNGGYCQKDKENNTSINNTSIKESNNINIITKEKKEKYGTYGRVKLTPDEYLRLVNEFGEDFIKNQIDLLDEYIESNNNKNKYTNFNLVLRRSIREKWFDRNNNKGGNNNTKKSFLDIMKEEYDK